MIFLYLIRCLPLSLFSFAYALHFDFGKLYPLQRLAGSEEVLSVPDANRFLDSPVNKEIQNSIQASLLKVEYLP
jgi:hypothetical protein